MGVTYEEAMQALRNADAAGNEEDAARLAIIADKLKPTASKIKIRTGSGDWHEASQEELDAYKADTSDIPKAGYGKPTPEPTTMQKIGEGAEEALRLSQGLMGMPVLGSLEGATTALGSKIPNISPVVKEGAKQAYSYVEPGIEKAMPYVKKAGEAVSDIASNVASKGARLLGRTSGMVDPNAVEMQYQIGKIGAPELTAALKEGEATPVVNRMVYNYARQHALPHEWAAAALDMTRGKRADLMGSHDIYDRLLAEGLAQGKQLWEIFPKYEDFSKLKLPEQLQLAKQAGVDMSTFFPQTKGMRGLAGAEGILGESSMLGHLPAALKGLVSFKLAPLLAAQSPKAVGNLAYGAGVASRVLPEAMESLLKSAPSASKAFADSTYFPSTLALEAKLPELAKDKKKATGGPVHLSLRHVYFHRKKRNG